LVAIMRNSYEFSSLHPFGLSPRQEHQDLYRLRSQRTISPKKEPTIVSIAAALLLNPAEVALVGYQELAISVGLTLPAVGRMVDRLGLTSFVHDNPISQENLEGNGSPTTGEERATEKLQKMLTVFTPPILKGDTWEVRSLTPRFATLPLYRRKEIMG